MARLSVIVNLNPPPRTPRTAANPLAARMAEIFSQSTGGHDDDPLPPVNSARGVA